LTYEEPSSNVLEHIKWIILHYDVKFYYGEVICNTNIYKRCIHLYL